MIYLYVTLNSILFLQTEEKMRCRISAAPSQKDFIRKGCNIQKLLTRYVSKKLCQRFLLLFFIFCGNLKLKMAFLILNLYINRHKMTTG